VTDILKRGEDIQNKANELEKTILEIVNAKIG